MRQHQGTFLSVDELSLACALMLRVSDRKPGSVRRHLAVTQRERFDLALDWVDSQPKLVRALAKNPASLEDGVFALEEKKGLLSRLLSSSASARAADEDEAVTMAALHTPRVPRESTRTEEQQRRLAETRALVEEALQDS